MAALTNTGMCVCLHRTREEIFFFSSLGHSYEEDRSVAVTAIPETE